MLQDKLLKNIVLCAIVLALFVVTLGAYTRLTDAGLGCPDWPGCYGHMLLPQNESSLQSAQANYSGVPFEKSKAWTEMIHRYVAGCLGILVLIIAMRALYLSFYQRYDRWRLPVFILFLICLQAALGMWTVTMKLLPLVVMSHLLGGISIFAMLCYYSTTLSYQIEIKLNRNFFVVLVGIFLVFCQIALGGWVSANYAGLACIGFPKCNGQWLPSLHLGQGFNLLSPIGDNYQGGLLTSDIRVTIQMIHRFGAIAVALYLLAMSAYIYRTSKKDLLRFFAMFTLLLLIIQISLGIMNVTHLLPLPVALAHNGVAAMLMATLLSMLYIVTERGSYAR